LKKPEMFGRCSGMAFVGNQGYDVYLLDWGAPGIEGSEAGENRAGSVDFSPDSTRLKAEELRQLPFADQIELFHLGYGLWDENADKKWRVSRHPYSETITL
jgi:hypothetical protein